jgi:hypothetical protein
VSEWELKEGNDRRISVALQCVAMTGSLHWDALNYPGI